MSEAAFQPRVRVTRVRTLGDAVPIGRGPFAETSDEPKIVPKSSDELRAEREAARDAQPMTTSCSVETCDFAYTGTAGTCRDEAAAHRRTVHPELVGARTHRGGVRFKRRGETIDPAVVAESRRLRQERDDAARLETIERGRAARGELTVEETPAGTAATQRPAADARAGVSSTTTTPTGRTPMNRRWNRETLISALQAVAVELGHTPTSDELRTRKLASLLTTKFLRGHGFESYSDLCTVAGLAPNTTGRQGGRPGRTMPPHITPAPEPAPEPTPDEEELPPAAALELRDAPPGHGTPLTRLLARLPADQLAGASSEYDAAIDRLQREHDVVLRALDLQERAA